ncbi:MAG: glycosyltransferase family 2 protein [Alphaproteobacteria bacterium]|jgi:glycosyltransferase involved in cell wall biosynthesis|nr:glycosyltransferase family 2 protein [Alphaproteobacteria bacterium]MDP7222158.1 glycosyltransferase family 2 protein [Alphaproteobacteria bacterium]
MSSDADTRKLPITVMIVTRNEEAMIEKTIGALQDFDEIIVIDSHSTDTTLQRAMNCGATAYQFDWNGQYPKKRGWCLDQIPSRHDWIFFVDADEIVTPACVAELRALWQHGAPEKTAGFFVKGRYVLDGHPLQFGLKNNKLCLLDRTKMEYPVIDDLDCPQIGDIEGHYQPVRKSGCYIFGIGQIKAPIDHHAFADPQRWERRHRRYAAWERCMDRKKAWPRDLVSSRQIAKEVFRSLPPFYRGVVMFAHSFIVKGGFLDGKDGYRLAKSRFDYYAHY